MIKEPWKVQSPRKYSHTSPVNNQSLQIMLQLQPVCRGKRTKSADQGPTYEIWNCNQHTKAEVVQAMSWQNEGEWLNHQGLNPESPHISGVPELLAQWHSGRWGWESGIPGSLGFMKDTIGLSRKPSTALGMSGAACNSSLVGLATIPSTWMDMDFPLTNPGPPLWSRIQKLFEHYLNSPPISHLPLFPSCIDMCIAFLFSWCTKIHTHTHTQHTHNIVPWPSGEWVRCWKTHLTMLSIGGNFSQWGPRARPWLHPVLQLHMHRTQKTKRTTHQIHCKWCHHPADPPKRWRQAQPFVS